jgi:capsular polysaccharide biosynthesis protein
MRQGGLPPVAIPPLGEVILRGATLLPFPRRTDPPDRAPSFVLDRMGRPVGEAVLLRGQEVVGAAAGAPVRRLAGRHVYGGTLFEHFGHFILESLARAWWLRASPGIPVLWHGQGRPQHPNFAAAFDLLGLGWPHQGPLRDAVTVEELVVPAPGARMGLWVAPRQAQALGAHAGGPLRPGRRVWLSRSRLPPDRGWVAGEAALQERLARAGWDVVHPEVLPLRAQLDALAGAEEVAGFMGSAFHVLLLLDRVPGRVRLVDRGLPPRDRATYRAIAEGKGFRQEELRLPVETIAGRGARASLRLTDPAAAAETLLA